MKQCLSCIKARNWARFTAITTSVSAFAKIFAPFYLIGSTFVFATASVIGLASTARNGRQLIRDARRVPDICLIIVLLYGVVTASYFFHSRAIVPITYLFGIFIFNGTFLILGFGASRAHRTVLAVLYIAAALYLIAIGVHTLRFGDIMRDARLNDIFGIKDAEIYTTLHQNIGTVLGLGVLAAGGIASHRIHRLLVVVSLPVVSFLLFHVAARTALVALLGSLLFLGFCECWVRSRKWAALSLTIVIVASAIAMFAFLQHARQEIIADQISPDAFSRTVREIQNPDPGFRLQIWRRTLHQIASEPMFLVFGRGIGMYPVLEGVGAPNWLIHPTEGSKYYPHNEHIEMLYETGIVGMLIHGILALLPILLCMGRWGELSSTQKAIASIYIFNLLSSEVSGAFALSYVEQYFFGIVTGIVAIKRKRCSQATALRSCFR